MTKTIAGSLDGRDNNFNLIRFIAASAVLVDHCFWLVAPEQAEAAAVDLRPLEAGRWAVDIFFVVSGFLVTRSVMTQPTLIDYGVARVLRLFPALIVVCAALAFVLGPLVTLLPVQGYFADPRPWLYVPLTASLITHTLTLPGVFDTVPEAGVVNSPLWTLRYEAFCYLLLAGFAMAGLFWTRARTAAGLGAIFALYALVTFATDWREQSSALDSTMRFLLDFFLGAALFVFAGRIKLYAAAVVVLVAIAWLTYGTPFFEAGARIALAYAVIWLALVPGGAIRAFNRAGDYSYGIYITCFPVQQTLIMLDPVITPAALLAISFPAVLGLAMLSWHFVEHPALRRKEWVGARLTALVEAARSKAGAGVPSRA